MDQVARAPGEPRIAQNAHWRTASPRRRLRAYQASTTRRVPEARVIGEVPA